MTKRIICPECNHTIDGNLEVCPRCGAVLSTCSGKDCFSSVAKYLVAIIAVIAIACFFFLSTEDDIDFPGKVLAYEVVDLKNNSAANKERERLYVTAYVKEDQKNATKNDLISTAMKVALDSHEKQSVPVVVTVLMASNTGNAYTDKTVALVTYIPDEKGYDGVEKTEKFIDAKACTRGFTKDELAVLVKYGELKQNAVQQDIVHTDEELMGKAVEELGLKVDPIAIVTNTPVSVTLK